MREPFSLEAIQPAASRQREAGESDNSQSRPRVTKMSKHGRNDSVTLAELNWLAQPLAPGESAVVQCHCRATPVPGAGARALGEPARARSRATDAGDHAREVGRPVRRGRSPARRRRDRITARYISRLPLPDECVRPVTVQPGRCAVRSSLVSSAAAMPIGRLLSFGRSSMPARRGRLAWALGLVALAAACSNMNGPQSHLANPAQLSSDLQTASGVLQSTVFEGFAAIDTAAGSPAAVATRPGALLGTAPIALPRTASRLYASAPQRLEALRTAARVLAPGIMASVVPAPLLGTTSTWDVTTHAYIQSSSATPAAPANGVRIILYTIDPATG